MSDDGGRRFLIKCNGQNYTSYNTKAEADAYIRMQMGKAEACPKKQDTYAVKCTWTIEERGV